MFLTLKGNKKLTVLSVKNLMRIWRREKDIPRIAVPLMIQGMSYINDHIGLVSSLRNQCHISEIGRNDRHCFFRVPFMPRQFPSRSD